MPYEIIKTARGMRALCEIEQKCPQANLAATETMILCVKQVHWIIVSQAQCNYNDAVLIQRDIMKNRPFRNDKSNKTIFSFYVVIGLDTTLYA